MTMDEINEIIAKNDHRLTPELAFSIAFFSAKKEREACAELCFQGTDMPMQTHVLDLLKAERKRIANIIKARGRKSLKDLLIEDKHYCPDWDFMEIDKNSPEYEACLCSPEIDCTDEQLMEEVRRRGFVIRDAQVGKKWVGLTDQELDETMHYWSDDSRSTYGGAQIADGEYVNMRDTWRYIEAKLKEKNT